LLLFPQTQFPVRVLESNVVSYAVFVGWCGWSVLAGLVADGFGIPCANACGHSGRSGPWPYFIQVVCGVSMDEVRNCGELGVFGEVVGWGFEGG
jgi:hypothetical protein